MSAGSTSRASRWRVAAVTLVVAALAARLAAAGVSFVTPVQGGQVVGTHTIEVATDADAVDRVEFVVDGVLVGVARAAPYRAEYDFGASLHAHQLEARVFSHGFHEVERASITTAAFRADVEVTSSRSRSACAPRAPSPPPASASSRTGRSRPSGRSCRAGAPRSSCSSSTAR